MFENDLLITDKLDAKYSIRDWVNSTNANPSLHLQRQAVAVLLAAIGLDDDLSNDLVLKGGTLMSIAFRSERMTNDVDLTATYEPTETVERLQNELNDLMRRSAAALGYASLRCRVQTVKKLPRVEGFPNEFTAPALSLTIAYAQQGTKNEKHLSTGKSSTVVSVDISFKEQVFRKDELHLHNAGIKISSYSIADVIAEKLRATIQQVSRTHTRNRRQDIYDIAFLLRTQEISKADKDDILAAFKMKCANRDIEIGSDTLDNPAIKTASQKEWDTISLEVSDLPSFEECYDLVLRFYRSLPW